MGLCEFRDGGCGKLLWRCVCVCTELCLCGRILVMQLTDSVVVIQLRGWGCADKSLCVFGCDLGER